MNRVVCLCLLPWFCWTLLSAQTPRNVPEAQTEANSEELQLRRYRVSVFLPPQNGLITDTRQLSPSTDVYVFDGEQELELKLTPGKRSRAVTILGSGQVLFYQKRSYIDPATDTTVTERIPYARCDLEEQVSQALLLITGRNHAEGGRLMVALQSDPGNIPAGDVLVMNLTADTLGFQHEETAVQIRASGSSRFDLPGGDPIFSFSIAQQSGERWRHTFSGRRRLSTEEGNLLLLVPRGAKGDRVQVFMFNGLN